MVYGIYGIWYICRVYIYIMTQRTIIRLTSVNFYTRTYFEIFRQFPIYIRRNRTVFADFRRILRKAFRRAREKKLFIARVLFRRTFLFYYSDTDYEQKKEHLNASIRILRTTGVIYA